MEKLGIFNKFCSAHQILPPGLVGFREGGDPKSCNCLLKYRRMDHELVYSFDRRIYSTSLNKERQTQSLSMMTSISLKGMADVNTLPRSA